MTNIHNETRQRLGFAILTATLTTVMNLVAVTWYVRGWQKDMVADVREVQRSNIRIEREIDRVKEVYIPRSEYQMLVDRVARIDDKQDRMFELLLEIRRDMQTQ